MQLREVDIDARGKEWIYLLDFGDAHWGDVCCDGKLLDEDLVWAKRKDAWWIDKGDKFNATTPDDRRYSHANVMRKYQNLDVSDMLSAMRFDYASKILPLADRCIGCLSGNHEKTLQVRHHINMHLDFLQDIRRDTEWEKRGHHILDLGYRAIVRLKFRITKTRVRVFNMFAWHGNSYLRERESRMRALRKHADQYTDINYFTIGHWHDRLFWSESSRISVPPRGTMRLQANTRYMGMSGTYLKGMMENHDGFPDKMDFPACELMGLRLKINPETLEMKEAED